MFSLSGKDFTSQKKSSHWKEGNFTQNISRSFTNDFSERIDMRISGNHQWRRTFKATFSYAVSSNNNKSFKQSNCCSFIGVSESITNIDVCEIIIVGGTMYNE